jgi:hypothetical protein
MTYTAATHTIPANLEIREEKVFCTDCGRWEYISRGGVIKHSTRCDFADTQITKRVEAPKLAKNLNKVADDHRNGKNVCFEDVFDAYQSGHLSLNDAMNSDF